jgi:hypothetical protein
MKIILLKKGFLMERFMMLIGPFKIMANGGGQKEKPRALIVLNVNIIKFAKGLGKNIPKSLAGRNLSQLNDYEKV